MQTSNHPGFRFLRGLHPHPGSHRLLALKSGPLSQSGPPSICCRRVPGSSQNAHLFPKHRVLFFSRGGAAMYLGRQTAVPHITAGYFGRQPRISEPELRLPKQEPPGVGGRARDGRGVWEERREGDRSLRKQLSLSWEPQGPLNFLCFFPPRESRGWGSSLPAVLRKVCFNCGFGKLVIERSPTLPASPLPPWGTVGQA